MLHSLSGLTSYASQIMELIALSNYWIGLLERTIILHAIAPKGPELTLMRNLKSALINIWNHNRNMSLRIIVLSQLVVQRPWYYALINGR